jgi:VCBS repeat-containing protein
MEGDVVTQTYTARVTDDFGAYVDQTLTITINGINDAAVITGTSTASLTETDIVQSTGGTLTATDVDSSAVFVAQTNVAGDHAYGKFSIDAAGVWIYTMNSAHNEFVAGTDYTDSITVATADGTTRVITVTIAGSNEAPGLSVVADAPAIFEGDAGDIGGDVTHAYSLVTFTVHRTAAADQVGPLLADSISWSLLTTGVGNISDADIHPSDLTGTVAFAQGALDATITIRVLRDALYETNEQLTLQLGSVSATTLIVNDDPIVTFASASQTVIEGNPITFRVDRTSGSTDAFSLNYDLLPSGLGTTALPVERTGTIDFAANELFKDITFNTVDDQIVNGDQRFYLSLSSANPDINVDGATLEGVVQSNDAEISIDSIKTSAVDSSGLVTYSVTLSRSGALGLDHVVKWSVAGIGENPANVSEFVLPPNQQITFDAESETQTFTFQARPGLIVDGVRSFEVSLDTPAASDHVVLGVDAALANVIPNGVSVSIVPVTTNLLEGTGSVTHSQTFEVRLSEATNQDVVVRWSVASYGSGTALDANAADFGGTLPTNTVTIAAGDTSAQITVTPSADDLVELSEKFYVELVGVVSGPADVVVARAVGSILNDDALLGFNTLTYEANEGASGSNGTLIATVARDGFNRSTVSAAWHVELIDATSTNVEAAANDFASGQDTLGTNGGLPSGRVELVAGTMSSEIRIALAGDNVLENSENFRIVLDTPGTGTQLKSSATVSEATILNDDAVFQMHSTAVSHVEGSGSPSFVTITVDRIGDTRTAASVTWTAVGTGANPTNSTDFNSPLTGTLYFAQGESSATISLAVKVDDVQEADEQLTVALTGTSSAEHAISGDAALLSTVATLTNDDDTVQFSTTALSQTEDAASTHAARTFDYTLSRTGDIAKSTTVYWRLDFTGSSSNADDFVETSGTAIFAPGSATATLSVQPVNDTMVEADETFTVRLDTMASGSGTKLGTTTSASGTLVNDDVAVSASLVSAAFEGSGDTTYTYTLSRSGDTANQASSINWSVAGAQILVSDGSGGTVMLADALSPAELASAVASAGGSTLQWAAGDATDRTITVTVHGDTVAEGDEAFQLTLASAPGDHSQLSGNGLYGVVHDDDALVGITAISASQLEGAAGTSKTLSFQVTRSGDLSSTVTVNLATSGATGVTGPSSVTFDSDEQTTTIHYTDGRPDQVIQIQGGTQQTTVEFVVAGDDNLETGEALQVTLSSAAASGGHNVTIDSAHTSASIAITNDDDMIAVAAPATISEGNSGATPLAFTLTRSGDTTKTTEVTWRIVGNGAVVVNADDFVGGQEDIQVPNSGMPSGKVIFAAGETSQVITVNIQGDTIVEADEGLALHLSVTAGNTQVSDTAVTLLADDVGYNAIAREAVVVEGNDPAAPRYMVFDLVRVGSSSTEAVHWAVTGIDASDVVVGQALSGDVTFNGADTGASVQLQIRQDSLVQVEKTATLTLTNGASATLATATSILADDDAQLSITAGVASVGEGTYDATDLQAIPYKELSFTVMREGNLNQVSTVAWTVNGAGITAADFNGGALPTGTLSFDSGETSKTITVQVLSDSIGEGDDVLTVNLGTPSSGTSNAVASAHTTVTNDDAMVTMTTPSVMHDEGDSGSTTYTYTLTRTGFLGQTSTVHWSVGGAGDTANAEDFSGYTNIYGNKIMPSGDVTFLSGETSKDITVTVNADSGVQYNWAYNYYNNHWYNQTASKLEADESFTVNLSNPTLGTSVEGTAQGVIVNDDVKIQVVDIHTNLPEGLAPDANGDVDPSQAGIQTGISHTITLARMGDPRQAVSIEWYVDNGAFTTQMQAGQASVGVITWAAGDVSDKVITFTPVADDVVEPDYIFALKVRPVTVDSNASAEIQAVQQTQHDSATLIDEIGFQKGSNTVYAVPFDSANWINDSNNGYLTLGTFNVKRDESGIWVSNEVVASYDNYNSQQTSISEQYSGGDYSNGRSHWSAGINGVNYDNASPNLEGSLGTATAGTDYTAITPGTLTFTEATRSQHLTVAITNDTSYETSEGFGVFLKSASNATIVTEQGTTTILDNDNPNPDYQVKVQGSTAIEGIDSAATFTVQLGKALTQDNQFTVSFDQNTTARQTDTNGQAADFSQYFDYSTDGGTTWKTNAPVFHFDVNSAAKLVDDQMEVAYQFNNNNGSSFDQWLDFSDLKAGAGYKVGGSANPNDIGNDWGWTDVLDGNGNTISRTATVWLAVRADAVVDTQHLSMYFAGSQGQMTGSFVGVADLTNPAAAINTEATDFFSRYGVNAAAGGMANVTYEQYAYDYQAFNGVTVDNLGAVISSGTAPNINYNWNSGNILTSGQSDMVLTHFQGNLDIPGIGNSQTINFYSSNDDGFVLLIDGQLVIDSWSDQGFSYFNGLGQVTLTPGVHTFEVWHYENGGGAGAELSWSLDGGNSINIIPHDAGLSAADIATAEFQGVQDYFHQYDPADVTTGDVKLLKFDIVWNDNQAGNSWSDISNDLTWSVGGLDASLVVAPQNGSVWSNLQVVQELTQDAFSTSVNADVALGSQASFDTNNDLSATGTLEPTNLNPTFTVTSDTIDGNGIRTVTVQVARADTSVDDALAYHLNIAQLQDAAFVDGSALRDGTVSFAAGVGTQDLVFTFSAIPVEAPPAPASHDVHVIVDSVGSAGVQAYIDTNYDGVLQGSEAVSSNLAFDNGRDLVDLAFNHVTVTFNDMPTDALNFAGFSGDDRIEINLSELGANGWKVGYVTDARASGWQNTTGSGQNYRAGSTNSVSGQTVRGGNFYMSLTASVSTDSNTNELRFQGSKNGHWISNNTTIATFGGTRNAFANIDGNGRFNQQVSFVHNPTIHVVVDGTGAFIDTDADGVHDTGETQLAFNTSTGADLIDLANNQVVVHFNDAPDHKLDFSGFGKDDRVEIDVQAFKTNGFTHIGNTATDSWQDNWRNTCTSARSSHGVSFAGNDHLTVKAQLCTSNWGNHFATNILKVGTGHSGGSQWADLADFGTGSSSGGNAIIDGNGGVMNRVSFVDVGGVAAEDIHVVVDAAGAFIDTNADGILQSSEAVDANRAFANGDDLVNLAANHVTVTFNDAPDQALNFQGFGVDDKVEINLSEMGKNGWMLGDAVSSSLSAWNWSSGRGARSSLNQSAATLNGNHYCFSVSASRADWQSTARLHLNGKRQTSSGSTQSSSPNLATFGHSGNANKIIDGEGSLMHQVSFVHNPTVHVVVEASGAYIDTNANGVLDATEAVDANRAFYSGEVQDGNGNWSWVNQDYVDLAHNTVVVKFNDAPDQALNFAGFGRDDRIEIDLSALQANGWHVSANNVTDNWQNQRNRTSNGTPTYQRSQIGLTGETHGGSNYWMTVTASKRMDTGYWSSYSSSGSWYSNWLSGSANVYRNELNLEGGSDNGWNTGTLATFGTGNPSSVNHIIDGNYNLINRVSMVRSDVTYVVVEADGGWIDTNKNGELDDSEKTTANKAFDFSVEPGQSNALVDFDHQKVVLHFNDAPTQALDLSHFGADDRIEIDRTSFGLNGWPAAPNDANWSNSGSWTISSGAGAYGYKSVCDSGSAIGLNASRDVAVNTMGVHTRANSSSRTMVLADFGDNATIIDGRYGLMNKVEFVTHTINVVVEADGAYIDTNANGVHDSAESQRAFNASTGADLIDLAHNKVVVHFNDAPTQALDFSGFNSDDRIEIDRAAFGANGWKANFQETNSNSGFYSNNSRSGEGYKTVSRSDGNSNRTSFGAYAERRSSDSSLTANRLKVWSSNSTTSRSATLANMGQSGSALYWGFNDTVNNHDRVSFVNPYITGFDNGTAVTITQGGSISTGGMSSSDTITVGAGVDSILINVPLVNDNIDESVETIAVTVTHQTGGDTFLVPAQSASATMVDNDSPQITLGANVLRDITLNQDYLVRVIDINNRSGDTPNVYWETYSMYDGRQWIPNYASNSLQDDAGSTQDMTVTLRYKGDWEVATISEELGQTGQQYSQAGVPMTSTNALHNSPPSFRLISGGVAEMLNGVATGYTLHELNVAAGTEQVLMRSAVTQDQANQGANALMSTGYTDGNGVFVDASLPMDATVTHVAPVIVVRNTTVDEAAGTVNIDVIAVGGDIAAGHAATVDYQTVDGQWVDRTFVFSREFATVGTQTATWSVSALTPGATSITGQLVDGNGYTDYVSGYFGQSVTGTVSPNDFVILGNQSANGQGLPSGTVTFLDGQKEATVTIRVRADNVGEAPEDFAVVLTGVDNGVEKLANPQAPLSYADLGYAGYAKIVNDDQVFTITGSVFNESTNSKTFGSGSNLATGDNLGMAVAGTPSGMTAPDGYTLHQFVVTREGDSTAAASVDWVIQVKGIDGAGGFVETTGTDQAAGAHQAETADFLTGSVPYGMTWGTLDVDTGITSSIAQTVTFAAGESQKVVTIAVKNDVLVEDAEQFKVILTNPLALPGNEGQPGVSETRGSADFLIGDNDGTKVSVALSWQVPEVTSNGTVVENAMLVDPVTGLPMVVEGTDGGYGSATNNHQLVMTFTRSAADLTASQAFFQIDMSSTPHWGASSLTLAAGDVTPSQQNYDNSWWRGTVNFAEGAQWARVVFDVADDNFVESDNHVKVTLFDAEHMPQATGATYWTYNLTGGLQDLSGIGVATNMADWNTTIRDPNAYTVEAVVKNDDVRLWLNSFSTPNGWGNPDYRALSQSANEGDSSLGAGVAASQFASSDNSDLELTFARAGRQDNDITLNWELALGSASTTNASADDFNSAYWVDSNGVHTTVVADVVAIKGTLTLAGTNSDTQALYDYNYDTVHATITDLLNPDRTVENNENFQLVFTSTDTANVKFTFDWYNEASGTNYYYGVGTDRTGKATMTVDMTLLNDDVSYGVAAHTEGKMLEGDTGATPNTVVFDVTRAIDATRPDGYTNSSTVYWRVVATGDHPVNAADFANPSGTAYTLDPVTGLPMGQVDFAQVYTDVWTGSYWQSVARTDGLDLLQSITLYARGDALVEFGETFKVELYNPSYGYVDQTAASTVGTIVNDDTGIVFNDFSVVEGDSGDTVVTATATRIGDLSGTSSMSWNKYNIDTNATDFGTGAMSGTGFTMGNGGETTTLASTDGYGEETKSFTLNLNGDTTVEGNEAFLLALSGFSGVDEQRKTSATVTVQNDDTVFSVAADSNFASNSYAEGTGSHTGTYHYVITRSNDTPQNQTVTWAVTSAGGRNLAGAADFTDGLPTGTVTFAPGEMSKTISFSSVVADSTPEADEVFTVQVTALGAGAEGDTVFGPGALGTIVNDDAAVFISDSQPITQIEGSGSQPKNYSFDVVRSGDIVGASTVNWEIVLDGTATADDFTGPMSGIVNFAANGTQTVQVGISPDSVQEDTESFHIKLSNASAGTTIIAGSESALGKIGDDDYTLSVADSTVDEGDGISSISFTVHRTGAADLAATCNWSLAFADTTSASANADDFRATSGSFTLPAGAVDYTFSVPVQGDVQWEADEAFTLNLSYDRNNGTTGTAQATGTLTNDDEGFSIATIDPVLEGSAGSPGNISFDVVREGNTSGSSYVSYSIAGSGTHAASENDFAGPLTGLVNFADGETSKTITVALAGDDVAEFDESYTVTLANAGPGSSIRTATATGVITNDDMGYAVTADVSSVVEGDDGITTAGTVTFTVTRTADAATLSGNDSTVDWAISALSGAASLEAADFVETTSGTVIFTGGANTATVTLHLVGDAIKEDAASMRFTLSNPVDTNGFTFGTVIDGSGTADVAVTDDDDQLTLSALEALASPEGNPVGAVNGVASNTYHFLVTRIGSTLGIATVDWAVAGTGLHGLSMDQIDTVNVDGTAAGNGVFAGVVSFAEGETTKAIDVVVKTNDVGSFDEQFSVSLSNQSYGSSLSTSTLTHTVQNDDPSLQLSMAKTAIKEGNEGADAAFTFTVTRTGSTLGTSTATWAIEAGSGSHVVTEDDFGGFYPSGLVTFAAGDSVKTVTVLTQGDNIREFDESFMVVLSAPSNGTSLIGNTFVDATLVNDDVGVSVVALTPSQLEGSGGVETPFAFELTADGSSLARSVRVTWHVEGTSSAGLNPMNAFDFVGNTLPSGTETFSMSGGYGLTQFNVLVAGDNTFGPSEQFKVVIDTVDAFDALGNPVGASVVTGEATSTTIDDDTLIGLRQAAHSVVEGDSGTQELRFYVDVLGSSADSPALVDMHVAYHLSGDTNDADFFGATSSTDAVLSCDDGTLGGTEGYYIAVNVQGDTTVEATERFVMHLDSAGVGYPEGGSVEVAQQGATAAGEIVGDDYGIHLVAPTMSQAEDHARFVFDVLRDGPVDQAMDVLYRVGTPALATGEYGVSANDFTLDAAAGQTYDATGKLISAVLHFDAGQSIARFVLEASHDFVGEADERFAVDVTVTSIGGHEVAATANEYAYVEGVITNDDLGYIPPDPYVPDPHHDQLMLLAA